LNCEDLVDGLAHVEHLRDFPELALLQLREVEHIVDFEHQELGRRAVDGVAVMHLFLDLLKLSFEIERVCIFLQKVLELRDQIFKLNVLAVDGVDGRPHLMAHSGIDEREQLLLPLVVVELSRHVLNF